MARRRRTTSVAAWLLVILATACSPSPGPESEPEEETMRLTSPAFEEGGPIPSEYTCDGDDRSPPLAWSNVPDGTAAFVLLVEDPDARGFVHWLLTDIPGDARELPAGEGDAIGVPGPNDFGRSGWGGPCPPSGSHRYEFTLWALPEPLSPDVSDAADVRDAAEAAALASASLNGVYARSR